MPAVTCLSVRRNLLVVRRYLLACVSGMLASGVVERLAPTTLRPRQRFPERRWQLRQVGHTRHCDRFHLPCGLGGRNDRPLPNADGGGGQEDGRMDASRLHYMQHARGQPVPRYLQKVRSFAYFFFLFRSPPPLVFLGSFRFFTCCMIS